MNRKQALIVYLAIRDFKSGSMDQDLLYQYAKTRVELRKTATSYEVFREELEGSASKKQALEKWLGEKTDIQPLFTFKQIVDLCHHNQAPGEVQDMLIELMTITQ